MSKLEVCKRKKGQWAGKSLVHRIDDNKREEYMVLLRQAINDDSSSVIRLWDHERYVYAHYNADKVNMIKFMKTLGFSFPKTYKDDKGKEKEFKDLAEQFTVLGDQGFECESKVAEWDIVSVRTIDVPDEKEPACNADGEILYLHKPENLKSVVIDGKTYYTGEYTVNTDEGDDGRTFFENKMLVKKAAARIVFDKTVRDWCAEKSVTAKEPEYIVDDNGLV